MKFKCKRGKECGASVNCSMLIKSQIEKMDGAQERGSNAERNACEGIEARIRTMRICTQYHLQPPPPTPLSSPPPPFPHPPVT